MSDRVRSVLVMESDPGTLLTCRQALTGTRYRVLALADPEVALKAVGQEGVETIVWAIDLIEGGLERLVEASRLFPLVPKIALTAGREFQAVVTAVNEAEVFRLLTKPLDAPTLRAAVEQALARAEALHVSHDTREAVERRRLALFDLETDYPGISFVPHRPSGYLLSEVRLRDLRATLRGTPLADLVENVIAPTGSTELSG